jgi:hypothetical protein
VSGHANQFQLSITDNTNGKSYTNYQTDSSAEMATAEWIAEAPTGTSILPLPTFGSVPFLDDWATINSTTGAIDDPSWNVTQVNMYNPAWGDEMTPTDLTDVGSGTAAESNFTVIQSPEPSTLACLASAATVLALRVIAARRRQA